MRFFKLPPTQQLFIITFSILFLYYFMTKLPIFPEEVLGMSLQKFLKIICGFLFSLFVLISYFSAKHY